ncbi:MAG: glycosyltransferase [Pseudomonadota bacterium]
MTVSFIITTYEVARFTEQCVNSVCDAARDGDQIIVVDDCSEDGSADVARAALRARSFPNSTVVALGEHTPGGVGIPANIGMSHARNDVVVFVDGDDWLHPGGFNAARDAFERGSADVMITRYDVQDTETGHHAAPTDEYLWESIAPSQTPAERRDIALKLNGVPWRKFYRRSFLQMHDLRFPEGDVFYEDNPFHWATSISAGSIAFSNEVTVTHRVNRAGQTLAARGTELFAFFEHYTAILGLTEDDASLRTSAAQWLMTNMAWHIDVIRPDLRLSYAVAADRAIKALPAEVWQAALSDHFRFQPIGALVEMALEGSAPAFAAGLTLHSQMHNTSQLQGAMAGLETKLAELDDRSYWIHFEVTQAHRHAKAATNQQLFDMLRARADKQT